MIIKTSSIWELIQIQAERAGDRPFLYIPHQGIQITFRKFGGLSASFARRLTAAGLRSGDCVLIMLANGLEMAVALLGVMAAGGTALPVNPRLKPRELEQILTLSPPSFAVLASQNTEEIQWPNEQQWIRIPNGEMDPQLGVRLFCRYSNEGNQDGQSALSPRRARSSLILSTSGTTGTPKGVLLTQSNLLANAGYVCKAHELSGKDVALCILPMFHVNGLVVTLLAPLAAGIPIVLPERFDAENLWTLIRDFHVTWFSAVPTILSKLLANPDPPAQHLSSLRFARSASAALPVAVLEEFEKRFGVPVIESYGISEAAGQVAANPQPPKQRKPGSVGLPVGNELAVVDKRSNVLSAGSIGEVVIRGANVFQGYLNNSQANHEALRDGWFHTGDLGYLDADGYLFLTGREKELINRSGEKISPREIEEIIHRIPGVQEVGVTGVPHPTYGEEVAAFITVRSGEFLAADEIITFCRRYLAYFKIPREVFFVSDLPRGPGGKIRRSELPAVYKRLKPLHSVGDLPNTVGIRSIKVKSAIQGK